MTEGTTDTSQAKEGFSEPKPTKKQRKRKAEE